MRSGTFTDMSTRKPSVPTQLPTKRRTAPMTEQGKMILRSARRKIAKEQEALAEQQRLQRLNRVQYTKSTIDNRYLRPAPVNQPVLAFQKKVVPLATAALASEGIRATVNVKVNAPHNGGWTDFRNIMATIKRGMEDDPINASAVLFGIIYHEGGHISHTVPPTVLINRYNKLITGTDRQRLGYDWLRKYGDTWNLVEDHRMEMMVVDKSPNKAKYFIPMVLDVVLRQHEKLERLTAKRDAGEIISDEEMAKAQEQTASSYPYVMWRRYMDKDFRRALRNKYIAKHGYEKTRDLERAMTAYVRATNPFQAVDAVEALYEVLQRDRVVVIVIDNHSGMGGYIDMPADRKDEDYQGVDVPDIEDDLDDEPVFDEDEMRQLNEMLDNDSEDWVPPSDMDFSIDGEDAPEAPEAPKGNGDDPGQNNEDVERSSTNIPDEYQDENITETLERMLNEAEAERNADPILYDGVREYNAALIDGVPGSQLQPLSSTAETNGQVLAKAETLAANLEEAFHTVTAEAAPTWREQQTHGVLNVVRYLTKQPNDREFFRDFDGGESQKPGYNLAVSVLLDYSASMEGSEGELAATAYATKRACDALDIPCTVLMWDHSAKMLFDGREPAMFVPVIEVAGSTDPTTALQDLANHTYERETHIVLLMTDDDFQVADGYLNNFRTEGTYFIGARYKHGETATTKTLQEMSAKGFDIVHGIKELDDLVDLLEGALTELAKVAS